MNGTYGTIKPAVVNIEQDVQILYNYKPDRGHDNTKTFTELPASNLLNTYESTNSTIPISGLYNLKLPLSIFNRKGIYTIYIKPKEMTKTIYAIGSLRDFPDIRGVIFKTSDFNDSQLTVNNGLVGYRIDYGNANNVYSRIITSSNRCSLVPSNGIAKYILNNDGGGVGGGDLIFCTVTPSSANSFNTNTPPSIGSQNESVRIVNTKFNPLMFEIEMVDHDAETLSYMIEGDQVRNLENGTFTVYNHDKEIYKQYETYTVKTQLGRPLFDIKTNKDVIDASQSYDNTIFLT
jgi:hypothetical protein